MTTILPASITSLRRIVAEGQAYKLRWAMNPKPRTALMDGTTANAILTVYDALKPENKPKAEEFFCRSPRHAVKLAALAWS